MQENSCFLVIKLIINYSDVFLQNVSLTFVLNSLCLQTCSDAHLDACFVWCKFSRMIYDTTFIVHEICEVDV